MYVGRESCKKTSRKPELKRIFKKQCVNESFKEEKEDHNAKLSFDLSFRSIHACVIVINNSPKAMDNIKISSNF